jgi:hypothetical protein
MKGESLLWLTQISELESHRRVHMIMMIALKCQRKNSIGSLTLNTLPR